MTWEVRQGDALDLLRAMPAGSVQTCITSPPYFGLRDYGHDGQIGLEATPDEYVAALVAVFAEARRVLRDDGTLWLNLGDSYARLQETNVPQTKNTPVSFPTHAKAGSSDGAVRRSARPGSRAGGKPKDLLGIPWMVAFALRADGWYLRSEVIWAKPNPMPESVRDRPTRAHEQVFLLSKQPRYFYDADAIREDSDPAQEEHNRRYAQPYDNEDRINGGQPGNVNNVGLHARPGPGGRNKRSVWTITTRPFAAAHFATFPPQLVEPMVLAGAPEGGMVLDPFCGAATTGLVALRRQRSFIGLELSPDYCELGRNRLRDDQPMFNVPSEVAA